MNTNNIKKYAPKARIAFYEAVEDRAHNLGIYADHIEEAIITGDVMQVGDNPFPASQKVQRDALVKLIDQQGFEAVIDHTASTWFNRFCAIRFMELKEYLDHGYRVLSHPSQANGFEILGYAADVAEEFGLNRADVLEMSLAGDKEEELYRQLLLGQCHALHDAMDFLFDKVDSVSELLLPDGLTRTDSILRSLVDDVPEEDWDQVEIIGWLYQFYISEKKDEVIGKVVKSEDIPAATQLFTPNWIVQYLVQNSVGRQWLQTYPESSIKAEMPYYIEPAEQTDEVNAQLAEITPDSLEPEAIKVLDPACGSGHILVEAYNTLKAIYDERGYRSREIPQLILENNLFGLDIDDRAAQLAGFALMMMAREDDRRIFTRGVKLNVLSLQESTHLDIPQLWRDLDLNGDQQVGQSQDLFAAQEAELDIKDAQFRLLQQIKQWFLQAKTLGSLIDVPAEYQNQLQSLKDKLLDLQESGNTAQKPAAELLLPFVQQAWLLSQRYDSVVANPPYMGLKYHTNEVKDFLKEKYKGYEKDLFSAFIIRNLQLARAGGQLGFMTPFVWMFISSYEQLRSKLINEEVISSLVQLEYSGFEGATVPICAFTLNKGHIADYKGCYVRLSDFKGSANQGPKTLEAIHKRDCGWFFDAKQDEFKKIPNSPIAYWVPDSVMELYSDSLPLKESFKAMTGMRTGDNNRFLRYWFEVSNSNVGLNFTKLEAKNSNLKWFPYNKGGGLKKWYGNNELIVNWNNDGEEIKELTKQNYPQLGDNLGWKITNEHMYFNSGITWGGLTSAFVSFRWSDLGALFDSNKGAMIFPTEEMKSKLLAFLSSPVSRYLLNVVNPTLSTQNSDIDALPIKDGCIGKLPNEINSLVEEAINISKEDEKLFEENIEFEKNQLVDASKNVMQLSGCVSSCLQERKAMVNSLLITEQSINKNVIEYHNFESFLSEKVSLSEITININPVFRFGDIDELQYKQKSSVIVELISYSIGCMMGRYSLDLEGIVYAHGGNEGFTDLVNQGAYKTFAADDDGIIPLTDMEWFPDDATYRFRDFVRTVWGEEHLQQNLDFVAESLCLHAIKPKRGESSLDTIRRYMSAQFYKDHLKTYKKRPIYWLFSSGKQKAFECLVYLHRYNESTLSRMRTEYVTPLLGKYEARLGQLDQQLESALTSEKTKLKKEITALEKKQAELRTFDDKLKHFADMRISLDLDDGVKVNYGKFGDLLADVKAIHGKVVK